MVPSLLRPLALLVLMSAFAPLVQAKDKTIVHHYYHGTQEQRKSTRFTILEWLKIKKRIKEMDVWLAMYSNPKKAVFRPELKLSYTLHRAEQNVDTAGIEGTAIHQHVNRRLRGQLFLTNLITSTLRTKLLNIDMGFEMSVDESHPLDGTARYFPRTSLTEGFSTEALYGYRSIDQAVTMRLLGSHIQDSSLILSYGKTQQTFTPTGGEGATVAEGTTLGLESSLYLTSFFALHGKWRRDNGAGLFHSNRREVGATVDIGLFGITGGLFDYSRSRNFSGGDATVPVKGQFVGLNVNF